ncbi:hypothetical protein MMC21_006092 [Puttea exsequens]|nr:hypothetical protein [Puttea exsequens]
MSNRTIEDLDKEVARFCEAQQSGISPHMQKLVVGYSLELPYVYQRADCLGVAEVEYKKEIDQRLLLVSSAHQSVVRLRYVLGHIYESLNRWRKAEELYMMVREARVKALGADSHSSVIVDVRIASCLISQGQIERGQVMIRCALHKLKTLKGESHRSTIATMGYLASAYMKQGKFEDAGALLDRQLTISTSSGGETHVDTLSISLNIALNQLSAGQWQEAEATSLRAMEMQQEVLGYDDREVLTGMHLHCRTLIEQGQYSQAKKIHE